MTYEWNVSLVLHSLPVLLRGVWVTVALWVPAMAAGAIVGLPVALARLGRHAWLRAAGVIYVELFRDIPVLIQLIWFFYALPVLIGVQLTPFVATALALALNTSAYCAEIFRAGIESLARGQSEAARALGMTRGVSLRRIILPQAVRRMLPAFTNRAIELAKVTSLASVLSVHELMYQGRLLSSVYYRPLEIFTTVAAIYFVLIWPGSFLAARLETRLARHG